MYNKQLSKIRLHKKNKTNVMRNPFGGRPLFNVVLNEIKAEEKLLLTIANTITFAWSH